MASNALACSSEASFSSPAATRLWVRSRMVWRSATRLLRDVDILPGQQQIDIGLGELAGQRQPRRAGIQRRGLAGGIRARVDQRRLLAPEIQRPAQPRLDIAHPLPGAAQGTRIKKVVAEKLAGVRPIDIDVGIGAGARRRTIPPRRRGCGPARFANVGLPARSWSTSRSSCGSLKAFHHSASGRGAASAPSPRLAGAISTCDGVVGGASTQADQRQRQKQGPALVHILSPACDSASFARFAFS